MCKLSKTWTYLINFEWPSVHILNSSPLCQPTVHILVHIHPQDSFKFKFYLILDFKNSKIGDVLRIEMSCKLNLGNGR